MFPMMHDLYAVVAWRVWWAPWRWNLNAYWWTKANTIIPPDRIATNITKADCIGLMKLLGYEQEIKC